MGVRILPTPDQLRELLNYDRETGKFFWKERPVSMFSKARHCYTWNTRYAGREAMLEVRAAGYLAGGVFDVSLLAHRVAWAIHYGEWPDSHIDHINGIKDDNRISNLRLATQQQNNQNTGRRKDNKSGYKGVCYSKASRKWMASISLSGKAKYLGLFADAKSAHDAYCEAAHKYHGEFARTE